MQVKDFVCFVLDKVANEPVNHWSELEFYLTVLRKCKHKILCVCEILKLWQSEKKKSAFLLQDFLISTTWGYISKI